MLYQLENVYSPFDEDKDQNADLADEFKLKMESFRGKLAIDDGLLRYSYAEVLTLANSLGQFLKKQGAISEGTVVIELPRSADLIISVVACILNKLPFVLFNSNWPSIKKEQLKAIVKPKIILTNKGENNYFFNESNLCIKIEKNNLNDYALPSFKRPTDYIVYLATSSGSSGEIKCAMIGSKGLLKLMQYQSEYFKLQQGQVVLQIANPGFDAIISEVLVSLFAGAILKVVAVPDKLLVPAIIKCLEESNAIDLVTMTPSVADCIPSDLILKVKTLVLAGEAANEELVISLLGKIRIINAFGPCETTVCSHMHDITDSSQVRCIGKALPHVYAKVMGESGQSVRDFESGELWIYGDAVGYGYLGLDDNSFGFDETLGVRYYKTRDQVEMRSNGLLFFVGRSDQNIKIRGQRVNLNEVVSISLRHDEITKAVSILTKEKIFVLFYEGTMQSQSLRNHLKSQLPEVSIPTHLIKLTNIPLNDNGKIDLLALQNLGDDYIEANKSHIIMNKDENPGFQLLKELLGQNNIGLDDNFFDVGGNSLKIVELMSLYSDFTGRDMDLAEFLKVPTARTFLNLLEENQIQLDPFVQFEKHLSLIEKWDVINTYNPSGEALLLTGVTGRVGQVILQQLLTQTNLNMICLGRGNELRIQKIMTQRGIDLSTVAQRFQWLDCDLNDAQSLKLALQRIKNITNLFAIIHCGAHVNHIYELNVLYQSNVEASYQLLEFAYQQRIGKFIYVGSSSSRSPDETAYDGYTGYDISKGMGEKLVRAAKSKGLNATILKLPLVYDMEYINYSVLLQDHFICRTLQCLEMQLAPNNDELVNCISAADCAKVLINLCNDLQELPEELVLIADEGVSWNSLLRLLSEAELEMLPYEQWRNLLLKISSEKIPLAQFLSLYKKGGPFYKNILPKVSNLESGKSAFKNYLQNRNLGIQSSQMVFNYILKAIKSMVNKSTLHVN